MSLEELRVAPRKTIGTKQTRKALEREEVCTLFLARDAEDHIIRPVADLGERQGVEILYVETMMKLGKACGIAVGAAVAAILR